MQEQTRLHLCHLHRELEHMYRISIREPSADNGYVTAIYCSKPQHVNIIILNELSCDDSLVTSMHALTLKQLSRIICEGPFGGCSYVR